jgi:hypothetical protein
MIRFRRPDIENLSKSFSSSQDGLNHDLYMILKISNIYSNPRFHIFVNPWTLLDQGLFDIDLCLVFEARILAENKPLMEISLNEHGCNVLCVSRYSL